MAWPTQLVTIQEVSEITCNPDVAQTFPSGFDIDKTIQTATAEVRDWLLSHSVAVEDVDSIENLASLKRPCASLVMAKIEKSINPEISKSHMGDYLRAMRSILIEIQSNKPQGGTIAPVTMLNVIEDHYDDMDSDYFEG